MAFTDDDRNILIATKTKVEAIENQLSDLPCKQHPPECTQETRLESLEKTRRRWYTGMVTLVIGAVVAGISATIRFFVK